MSQKPRFITFEGGEGAGKTTLIAGLSAALEASGERVLVTREPGAGKFGFAVRDLLLHSDVMPPEAELFLFLADRANHVRSIVRPALAGGNVVLCDRYADSTLVYQAIARGLEEGFVRQANTFATGGLIPDLTVLIDLPPRVGLSRLSNPDRVDAEPIEFHERVRDGFLRLAAEEPHRFKILNGTDAPEIILSQAQLFVDKCLAKRLP